MTRWCCPAWCCRSRPRHPTCAQRSTPPAPPAGPTRPVRTPRRRRPRCCSCRASMASTRRSAPSPSSSRSAGSPAAQPAAVVRGTTRARIGAGTTGPGAALWVEVTESVDDDQRPQREAHRAGPDYKALVTTILQQRGAWQLVDGITRINDPSTLADTAGYAPYLTNEQKLQLLETVDVGRAARARHRSGPRSTSPSWTSPRPSARTSRRAWTSSSASSCCASSSPPSARSWAS